MAASKAHGICRLGLALLLLGSGCSVKRMALNKVGDALAGSGTTFASDNDPELIKAAVPFSLKLMESVLAESPEHQPLLLATSSGFTQFAYAFVQQEADETESVDFEKSKQMRQRARNLYLRARDYGLRALELRHQGITNALRDDPRKAVQVTRKADVPLLYWTAVSWAGSIAVLKDNPDLIADLGAVEALIDRALLLQEDYNAGAIHTFLITYEMGRRGGKGDPVERSRRQFERAMELTGGQQAAPLVSYAEAVALQQQDLAEFQRLLEQALAIDVDARPDWRLANLIMQQRARWLLSQTNDLFLIREPADKKS